jgi:hypothetical protein
MRPTINRIIYLNYVLSAAKQYKKYYGSYSYGLV